VEFEGDSLEVVQAVNRESPCWKSYGHLIADIQTKLLVFHRYAVRHVGRSANI
jgi:hypothetical protein